MKVLIGYDDFLTEELFRKIVKEKLETVIPELELQTYEVRASDTPASLPKEIGHLAFGNPQDLLDRIEDTEILLVHKAPVTSDVIDKADSLRIIGCARGGPDNVDIKAATERGIPICHAPGRNANAVAELTMGLIISELRHICRAQKWVREGNWKSKSPPRDRFMGMELRRKILGIIGFGKIGSRVAEIAKGFGMKIVAYDPYVDVEKMEQMEVSPRGLDDLLAESDVVTLHVRLPENEKHLIGKKELNLMKEDAYLINTSDGPVIDEEALFEALREERIAGAAQDSWLHKPVTIDNPWLQFSTVTVTPGLGGGTIDVPATSIRLTVDSVANLLKGKRAELVKNTDVLDDFLDNQKG
ncbi:MAG: NAD(P)-dependent oxidoreductase [Promethearchaeia archaeon]